MRMGWRRLPRLDRCMHALPRASLIALTLGCGSGSGDSVAAVEPSAAVGMARVERGEVRETIEALGSIELDPARTRTLALVRAGQVQRILVASGQEVSRGERLLELGPLPARSLPRRRAEIDLDFAKRGLERAQRLHAASLATNAELSSAEKEVATGRAALEDVDPSAGDHSSELRADEASIVVRVLVTPGSLVQGGDGGLVLAPKGAIVVRAAFEAEDAARLGPSPQLVVAPIFAEPGAASAPAGPAQLHVLVDAGTQRVEALAPLPAPPAWLRAGARVRVSAVLAARADAVRLPRDALLERDGSAGVFVVTEEHAHWRPLTLGVINEGHAEVLFGLEAGDVVVTAGRTSLSDGLRVRGEAGKSAP